MKRIIVIFLLIISTFSYSDSIYGPFDYKKIQTDPIKWSLDEGIYFDSIDISLTSEYGKIFYLINSDLSFREPIEYDKKIRLPGIDGSIMDYNILVILEKEDGRLEFYSQVYRIDKTKTYKHEILDKKIDEIKKELNKKDNSLNIKYTFPVKEYNISYFNREFIFPQNIVKNNTYDSNILLEGEEKEDSVYLVNLTYSKNKKIYTEIHGYQLNLTGTKPPSFGSLYWGQVYKQSYKISIKPDKPEDKIYYWIKEWKNSELIFGPPPVSKLTKWNEYSEPIELTTEYGMDGITGIAAFAVGETGEFSEIAGPYYFKINGIEKTFEQVFPDEKKEIKEKKVYIDEVEYKQKVKINNSESTLRFSGFDDDDRFYFKFDSVNREGKSELLPCTGEYVFKNIDGKPVVFDVFMANGEEVAYFELLGGNMILPVIKDYSGNRLDLSDDTLINFYMPNNTIRYEFTGNLSDFLKVTKDSPVFTGSILLNAESGSEKSYKLKFAAFDSDNKIIGDSGYYYFNIDKSKPSGDVKSEGIDLKIFHNEKQVLKLIPPEDDLDILYRLSEDDEWIEYEKPISFYPPLYGKYSIKVFVKTIDKVGNTRENEAPFEIFFDTRAIFVDASSDYVGNGTEKYPINSFEKAIDISKKTNIKLLYVLSKKINITSPIIIDSDIIVQPYKINSTPLILMNTKSVWKRKHMWFDVFKNGYLEIRKIDFEIQAGNTFINIDKSKVKLYDLNINFSGDTNFSFFKNKSGKIGLNNIYFSVTGYPEKFNFLSSSKGYSILKNLKFKIQSENVTFFDLYDSKYFDLDTTYIELIVSKTCNFTKLNYANASFKNVIFRQTGYYDTSSLFNLRYSNLFVLSSDFVLNGRASFKTELLGQQYSESNISDSLFWVNESNSVVGFNSLNSRISFKRNIINFQNILDYSYNFRCKNSTLKISSSIIRNLDCLYSIFSVLDNSSFEGVNNSFFNVKIKDKEFGFWITDKSNIISVNSIYFFDIKREKSSFLYLNNDNVDIIKPKLVSNIISSNIDLFQNINGKSNKNLNLDYSEKNIYYSFTDEFQFDAIVGFFIPIKKSPLLEGGIPSHLSPIKIPEKDFFGRNRILSGYGIDIGAVQKSGNF